MRFIPLNDILSALAGNGGNLANAWNTFIDPCEQEFKEMGKPSLKVPADKVNECWRNGTPVYKDDDMKWNGDRAFELAEAIKARRQRIEDIKKAQQAELEREQNDLAETEKQYRAELSHIRYVGDDKQLQLLIPRDKMFDLVKGLTKAINDNKEAKSYKITINL